MIAYTVCFDFFGKPTLQPIKGFSQFWYRPTRTLVPTCWTVKKFGNGLMFLLRKSIITESIELIYFCGHTCRACVSGSDAGANFEAEHSATRCAARRNSWTVTRRSDKDNALWHLQSLEEEKNKNHEWTVDAVFTSRFSHSYCCRQFVLNKVKCVCKGNI